MEETTYEDINCTIKSEISEDRDINIFKIIKIIVSDNITTYHLYQKFGSFNGTNIKPFVVKIFTNEESIFNVKIVSIPRIQLFNEPITPEYIQICETFANNIITIFKKHTARVITGYICRGPERIANKKEADYRAGIDVFLQILKYKNEDEFTIDIPTLSVQQIDDLANVQPLHGNNKMFSITKI